jgi:GT2 family glycosyltransferase
MTIMKTLAIIINYHSSHFTLNAVTSILESDHIGSIQIVVADNSCDASEAACLRKMLPREVILRVNTENIGFGRACNMAFERYDSDMVLLMNPDACLLDDCLIRLQSILTSSGNIGAVGPQAFWDAKHEYKLPPSYPPILHWLQPVTSIGSPDSAINQIISAIWRCFAIKVWRANRTVRVGNLSGGNVLIKREAILKAGGLFDPRFFLYYEDTDLFIRLRQAGYHLLLAPGASAVHYYDQCDQKNWSGKRSLMVESHHKFMQKHCHGLKLFPKKMTAIYMKFHHQHHQQQQPARKPMETFRGPFVLKVPCDLKSEWLFEWSPNADFIPAAGRFGKGSVMEFSEDCWHLLTPGTYYGRIGNTDCLGLTHSNWMWIKGK